MATIKFILQSKLEASPIYLRLSMSRYLVVKRRTGKFIDYRNWNYDKGMPKQNEAENKRLSLDLGKLKTHIIEKLNDSTGTPITGDWLSAQIDNYYGRTVPVTIEEENNLLTDHIQYIIDNAGTKKVKANTLGLSPNRVKSYVTFKNTMTEYQKVLKKDIDLMDVDRAFGFKLKDWLLNDKKYSHNYAGKIIDNLKAVCQDAEKYKKKVDPGFRHIETFSEKPEDRNIITLSWDELKRIEDLDIKDKDLHNARLWFLLGCEIGQRPGDLLSIGRNNLRERDGKQFIDFKQQKTGKDMTIGVNEEIKRILDMGLPYKITVDEFNDRIKSLCLLAGITEEVKGSIKIQDRKVKGLYAKYKLVTGHIVRRSFATNYYKIIPTPVLMGITGHTRESLFNIYIGVPEDKDLTAVQNMEIFNRVNSERLKGKE